MRGVFRAVSLGAVLLAALAASTASANPRYESAFTTDNRETRTEKSTFAPDTPKVYVVYVAVDIPKGSKMRAVWIAEKVDGVKENTEIVKAESTSAGGTQMGLFSYTKPGSGWPAGTYRVDLYVEDKVGKQVRFKVAKP